MGPESLCVRCLPSASGGLLDGHLGQVWEGGLCRLCESEGVQGTSVVAATGMGISVAQVREALEPVCLWGSFEDEKWSHWLSVEGHQERKPPLEERPAAEALSLAAVLSLGNF